MSSDPSTAAVKARTSTGSIPLAVWAITQAIVAVYISFLIQWPELARSLDQFATIQGHVVAVGVLMLVQFGAVAYLRRRAGGLQPGTVGRGRLMFLAWVSPLVSVSCGAVMLLLVRGGQNAIETGFAFSYTLEEAVLALDPLPTQALTALVGVAAVSLVLSLAAYIGAWFLLPRLVRVVFWALFDVALAAAFVYVMMEVTLVVESTELANLVEPIGGLTVVALAATRLSMRLVPLMMAAFERSDFHLLVAARHLRSKKSGFLAAIGSLSILAVAISSCMLTSVLSVMGGFRDDLKRKILGNHAHVVVDSGDHDPFDGWQPVLDAVRGVPGIVAATPYLEGEVMATSASNREGIVLRGIDPDSIGSVTDLEDNLTSGSLDYLREPGELLDLPPEQRRTILPLNIRDLDDEPDDEPLDGGSLLRELEGVLDLPEHAEDDVNALREAMEADAEANRNRGPPRADVLPGIIVGKELARSLRLFVGDELDIVSPFGALGPAGPMPKSRRFRVAGIFYSGMYEYDMKLAYVLLPSAQSFLNKGEAISGIELKVEEVERASELAEDVRQALIPVRASLRVQDWQELNKNLFGALALEKLAMFVTLGIAVLIAGFCVFGTLTLMVQEKSREVGILKAMGTTSRSVVGIFLFEGLLIGVYGALSGLGMGYLVVFVLEHFGIRLNPEVYYIDRLPVHTEPAEFIAVGIAAVAVCLVATVFPALLASRMRPVDALRHF